LNPKVKRPNAHMPALLRGARAREDAAAMAAYLASLQSGGATSLVDPNQVQRGNPPSEQSDEHKPLFEKLHCAACHDAPDAPESGPNKITLRHVAEKFARTKLVEFLRAPEAHYKWTRMPNFKLNAVEAKELAEFLNARAEK